MNLSKARGRNLLHMGFKNRVHERHVPAECLYYLYVEVTALNYLWKKTVRKKIELSASCCFHFALLANGCFHLRPVEVLAESKCKAFLCTTSKRMLPFVANGWVKSHALRNNPAACQIGRRLGYFASGRRAGLFSAVAYRLRISKTKALTSGCGG